MDKVGTNGLRFSLGLVSDVAYWSDSSIDVLILFVSLQGLGVHL